MNRKTRAFTLSPSPSPIEGEGSFVCAECARML